jgi:Mor family transcriptional regulator
MFRLACPKGVHDNRTISFLKNEQELIETEHFRREPDEEGLVHYTFPGMEEDNFRYIIAQLQHQGVTMIGVDTQLTEKKIMKLANLIEMTPLDQQGESGLKIVKDIKKVLAKAEDPTSSLWMQIANIIGDHEDKKNVDDIASTEYDREFYEDGDDPLHHNKASDSYKLSEQKIRKVIRKMIRQ